MKRAKIDREDLGNAARFAKAIGGKVVTGREPDGSADLSRAKIVQVVGDPIDFTGWKRFDGAAWVSA